MNEFSGEEVGAVTSQPCDGSVIMVERKNSEAPLSAG